MKTEAPARAPDPLLHLDEAQLRSVLLAQAIEHADTAQVLVSQPEREAALREAVAAAQAASQRRVRVADVLLARARTVVQRAAGREATIAALHAGDARWRWLGRALPLLSLLAGLAADRVANAHRVDLLSPPLLLVLAWNLAVYAAIAVRALRRRAQGLPSADAPARWLRAAAQRLPSGGRGLAARIAADFHVRWFAATPALQGARASRVLHLCAAAGGAGLALSLLLRGLVVRYQFGWESTFLDAQQVHTIARVLFWPLTALTGLAPFSLAEIAATQDFAGTGGAGNRWVWMYAGLLALVVVAPRLALAALARWREARLARQCTLDTQAPAFDALRAALPAEVVLGVVGANAEQQRALAHVLALHGDGGAPGGDRLRFAPSQGDRAAAHEAVDAVLLSWGEVPRAQRPAAWQDAPALALPWTDWGASWMLEPALPAALAPTLPREASALQRLAQAWAAQGEQRFGQALHLLAGHLRDCQAPGGREPAALALRWQALDGALRHLHGLPEPAPQALAADAAPASAPPPAARGADGVRLAATSAGAAAGAAAGAKAGALVDLGLGGLTLGAGTALGALLGGAVAWTLRGGGPAARGAAPADDHALVQAACIQYLVAAHQARVPAEEAARLAALWREQVAQAVAAHAPALDTALRTAWADGRADPLQAALRSVLQAVLQRSFGPGTAAPHAAHF